MTTENRLAAHDATTGSSSTNAIGMSLAQERAAPGRGKWWTIALLAGAVASIASLPGCRSDDEGSDDTPQAFTKEGLENVHATMAGYVDRGALPGLVTLLNRRGEVHVDPIGHSSIGGEPMRRDTIFRIASMTKPITAAAAMILIEEGKLHLDEPVERLLPELANRKVLRRVDGPLDDTVPAERSITVRDLLTFTMGFGIVFPFDTYPIQKAATALHLGYGPPEPRATPDPDEWLRRLATLPLMFQPGQRWVYNTGSDVLGVLIARAAGKPFDAFLRERIFQPLGMKDTDFSVPPAKLDRFTVSYLDDPATGGLDLFDGIEGSAWSEPPAFPSGAGGLVSTADDFLMFARMLLSKGQHDGAQILSAASVEAMTTDQLLPSQKVDDDFFPDFWAKRGWGFGVAMITQPDDVSQVPGRYGWFGGLGTYWFSDPGKDFVGVLLTQRAFDETSPENDFWKAAYQAMNK
jgi:CubicO group peptidase (beta-lactamase class C family)